MHKKSILKDKILEIVGDNTLTREEITLAVKNYFPTHGQIARVIWGLVDNGKLVFTNDYKFIRGDLN